MGPTLVSASFREAWTTVHLGHLRRMVASIEDQARHLGDRRRASGPVPGLAAADG